MFLSVGEYVYMHGRADALVKSSTKSFKIYRGRSHSNSFILICTKNSVKLNSTLSALTEPRSFIGKINFLSNRSRPP